MRSDRDNVIFEAEFDEKLKTYFFVGTLLLFLATVAGILLIPFWLLGWGAWHCRKYFENLHCKLGERSLMVGRGIFFRVEKTIPLDKIQDMTLREGPLLKAFGLLQLQIETAGQSTAQGIGDAKLVGIKNAREFRDRVLDQRDLLAAGEGGSAIAAPSPTSSGEGGVSDTAASPAAERLVQLAEENNRVLQDILTALRK